MAKKTILITKASAFTYPSFIKCLRNGNFRIIGTDYKEGALGFAFTDKNYVIPYPEDKKFIDKLLVICRKEKVNLLIPVTAQELIPLAKNADRFKKQGTQVMISSLASILLTENKFQLFEFCRKNGIPVPEFIRVNNYENFKKAVVKLGYPQKEVCFKPVTSSGSRGFRILSEKPEGIESILNARPDNVFINYEKLYPILEKEKNFAEILLMEYLPGDEYSVDILADQGKPLVVIPRIRSRVVLGGIFAGETRNQKNIINYSKILVEKLNLDGVIGMQFRMDKNNIPKILEINPRVHGGTILSAAAGANIIVLAVKKYLNEKFSIPKIKWGTKILRYYGEVFIDEKGKFFTLKS